MNDKIFIFFLTAPGSGTHLLMDLIRNTDFKDISSKLIRGYLSSVVYSRKDPNLYMLDFKYFERDFKDMKAIDIVKKYYEIFDFKPMGDMLEVDNINHFLGDLIKSFGSTHLCVINYFDLIMALEYELPDGTILKWSHKDRDDAFVLLRDALMYTGYKIRQIGFIRNPINIYFSQLERFKNSGFNDYICKQQIVDFFNLLQKKINDDDIFIIKYEDICSCNDARYELYRFMGLNDEKIKTLDLSFIHTGELNKWALHPRDKTKELVKLFTPILKNFGYEYRTHNMAVTRAQKIRQRFMKIHTEIHTINKIFSGDHFAEAMYFRHRFSLLSRIYKHLNLLIPLRRQQLNKYYLKHKIVSDVSTKSHIEKLKYYFSKVVQHIM